MSTQDPSDVEIAIPRPSLDSFFPESVLSSVSRLQSSTVRIGLGTLRGVIVPTVQNILGILLFVRFSFMIGVAGVRDSTLIVIFCTMASILTSFSLSAIMTNTSFNSDSDGAQTTIRRTLGSSLSTSISVLYYFSLLFACALEILGAAEVLFDTLPSSLFPSSIAPYASKIISIFLLIVLFIACFLGIEIVAALAPLILVVVLTAIGFIVHDLFTGVSPADGFLMTNLSDNWSSSYTSTFSFFPLLALFYPLTAGMLAGSDKSDTLSEPAISIPRGTLFSVLSTTVLYLTVLFVTGGSVDRSILTSNPLLFSSFGPFNIVAIGSVGVSLGSALQALSGSPRIFARLCSDVDSQVLSHFRLSEGQKEPRKALLLTAVTIFFVLLAGKVDVVAPIVTLCYLLYCGSINLSTFVLHVLHLPSFRPSFKYSSWITSLAGSIMTMTLMFLVSPLATAVVLFVLVVLMLYLKTAKNIDQWSDSGFKLLTLQFAHSILLKTNALMSHHNLTKITPLSQVWRPDIITFLDFDEETVSSAIEYNGLISFLSHTSKGRGFTTIMALVKEGISLEKRWLWLIYSVKSSNETTSKPLLKS
ncbi:hypothetical protein GEMRC1_003834 [Eukaryota sp. GEM-RC1]